MRRPYVTAARLADLHRLLSPRDRAIISTLDDLRVATTNQLARLHFGGLTPLSASRQAMRTLRRLQALRVLSCLERQPGGVRAGSSAAVWALDLAGQRLASAAGPAGGREIRTPWTPSLSFLAHRLLVSETFVLLTEAARAGRCELIAFDAEPLSWRRFAGPHGPSFLKPDAHVRLGVGSYERGAFVEIDRATESPAAVARQCTAYRRYWELGREQDQRGYFPQVVFAVPSERRKTVLVDVFRRQPEESWPLFRVVLQGDLVGALIGEETT